MHYLDSGMKVFPCIRIGLYIQVSTGTEMFIYMQGVNRGMEEKGGKQEEEEKEEEKGKEDGGFLELILSQCTNEETVVLWAIHKVWQSLSKVQLELLLINKVEATSRLSPKRSLYLQKKSSISKQQIPFLFKYAYTVLTIQKTWDFILLNVRVNFPFTIYSSTQTSYTSGVNR